MAGKKTWDWQIGNKRVKNDAWNVDKFSIPFYFMNFPTSYSF